MLIQVKFCMKPSIADAKAKANGWVGEVRLVNGIFVSVVSTD